jgi:glycosyltransferase involved in cell wall biosynthesis
MDTITSAHTKKISVSINAPIPVLHIIKSLGRGGAETLLPESLSKHDKEKYQFHYIYFLPWKYQMVQEIEDAGGKVTCLSAKNNFQILRQVFKIVSYVKQHKIRVIHCHLPWAGIVGRIVGKLTGVPVVYTEHNKWERYHKLTYYANKLSFSSQHRVIAVSGDVASSIKSHYGSDHPKVQVVLNGINTEKYSNSVQTEKDVRRELNIPSSAIVIGITCVFRVQKRLTIWVEIAKKLHDKFPDTVFLVVGDGVLHDEVHDKARVLEMDQYVHFVGLQSEIRPYLKAMDIFMMTSEFEGMPIALLEAMSMECMPACTAAGGIPELIQDEENGIIVPVDEPLKLAERLAAYLQQPLKVHEMGRTARETVVRKFSMQKMVGELEAIYDDLINLKS